MRVAWIFFLSNMLGFDSTGADQKWIELNKEIANKMKSKNLVYKRKDNDIRVELSERLKRLVEKERGASRIQTKIYRYIDRSGKPSFSDRVRHEGYKAVKSRTHTKPKRTNLLNGSFFEQRKIFEKTVRKIATTYQIPPNLLHAIIATESGYNADAVSKAGAVGLMQLMPATANRYGVKNRKDPIDSMKGGSQYLRHLLDLFDNDLILALAAYNAGENAVIKYGRTVPPYKETQNYIRKVLNYYDEYSGRKKKL